MTWVKYDDTFHDDPRILAVSLAAVGLHHLGMVWASRHLTDGWVSQALVRQRSGRDTARLVRELMQAGLWTEAERNGQAGYAIAPDLVALQQTRDHVERKRAEWRERQRRSRSRQDDDHRHDVVTRDRGVTLNGVTALSPSPDPDPDPDPGREDKREPAEPALSPLAATLSPHRSTNRRRNDDGGFEYIGSLVARLRERAE